MQYQVILKITFWCMIAVGFSITILSLQPTTSQEIITNVEVTNQSMTNNDPSYGWGWSDDYCLRNMKLKDGSIIRLPRCEF